jgi:hypothetical protein
VHPRRPRAARRPLPSAGPASLAGSAPIRPPSAGARGFGASAAANGDVGDTSAPNPRAVSGVDGRKGATLAGPSPAPDRVRRGVPCPRDARVRVGARARGLGAHPGRSDAAPLARGPRLARAPRDLARRERGGGRGAAVRRARAVAAAAGRVDRARAAARRRRRRLAHPRRGLGVRARARDRAAPRDPGAGALRRSSPRAPRWPSRSRSRR